MSGTKATVRFAIPASLGAGVQDRAQQLQAYLAQALNKPVEVSAPATYELLAKELLSGRSDAAWVPPFVCARIEAMGVRVMVRGVRNGASTYRAALVCQRAAPLQVGALAGVTAVWSDRDSVAGYLLPQAYLRERGVDPARVLGKQDFAGSYRACLEAVASGAAQMTSVFAPAAKAAQGERTGVAEVWPENEAAFRVLAYTEESPNDGVAGAMNAPAPVLAEIEKVLLGLHQDAPGSAVLKDCFHLDRFEVAPRMGYRALYRVALASL